MATIEEQHGPPPAAEIRLVIIEDDATILSRQIRLLERFEGLRVVGSARDGRRGLETVAACQPDVVLLDLGLPDLPGTEVTREIRGRHPDVEVLVFTIFEEEEKVLAAIRAGASGYLLKGTPADRIVEAIKDVHNGGSVIQPQLARTLLRRFQTAEASAQAVLTAREAEILALIAKGLNNRDAAQALGVSRGTVRTHLEHIYAKLDVSNRTEAVTEAIRRGIIEP